MPTVAQHDAVIDAAMSTAATLLGMQVVYFGTIDHDQDTYEFHRVVGDPTAVAEGSLIDFATSFCRHMVDGGPPMTCDAAADPVYGALPPLSGTHIVSYAGVPICDVDGRVIGTLCGFDSRRVVLGDHVIGVLRELAGVIAARLGSSGASPEPVIRRTAIGWVVGDSAPEDSLTNAMVLADLLSDDLTPPPRPERPAGDLDELGRLRTSVEQLEHALAARVVVEQAIGIVAERSATPPREAFEALRRVARRSGRRVHDLARDVVDSVTEQVDLPEELSAR